MQCTAQLSWPMCIQDQICLLIRMRIVWDGVKEKVFSSVFLWAALDLTTPEQVRGCSDNIKHQSSSLNPSSCNFDPVLKKKKPLQSLCTAVSSLSIILVVCCYSQALLIRALLEYSQCAEVKLLYGLALVGGIFLMELTRSWSLAFMWAVSYRTAARLRGATLTFAFQKILRLRSTKDIGTGEVKRVLILP